MLTIPDRMQSTLSLKDLLAEKYGNIYTVHRLDRETSGVILFAKDEESHKHFSAQFEDRQTVKIYNGLVHGSPIEDEKLIDEPIAEHPGANGTMVVYRRGKPSQTQFNVLERFGQYSWMQFRIFTGRTHQIRVHMKHVGHPIVCDILYGNGQPFMVSAIKKKFKLAQNEEEERPLLSRLALHAAHLEITDPEGVLHILKAEPPKDLRAVLQQLRKWK